ncbi:MAG TPA: FxSxx-COOH system tetratricopeptide repeat protein, partial [Candidatus Dormibacteraeota bacterium]
MAGTDRARCGFGELLRRQRAAAGLSQAALAARSGISTDAISMLERGVRSAPRNSTVARLAEALRLGPAERDALAAAARGRAEPPPRAAERLPEPGAGIAPDPVLHFAGREDELAWLARELPASRRVAVHGLGGVGKTQLAARYADGRRADYPDGVFWLRADEEDSFVGDLAGLAWRLGLDERDESAREVQIEAVLRWLRAHGGWLVVLDNVEPEAAAAVRRWLPPGLPGHLLVTSRTPMWSARLGLEPLPVGVATRFLLQRTGLDDAPAAGAIAEALGCLPLALEQAAAYVTASGRDLAGYAELLRRRQVELLREGTPEDYPQPVAGTWRLSLERVEAERPEAADLLRLCAFLAPDDIPVRVLTAGAGELPGPLAPALADDIELDRTIATLLRFSLVHRRSDELRVHRLVQAVVRESIPGEERDAWLAAAVRMLRATFPPEAEEHPERWPLCARLLAHVSAVARLAGDRPVEPRALGWVVNRAAMHLWTRGATAQARTVVETGLRIRERALGPDDPDTAESVNDLGIVLAEQEDMAGARLQYERGLDIRLRALGPDHLHTAESHFNVGIALQALGELAAARAHIERTLAIRRGTLGADHPQTAMTINDLGSVLRSQGDLAGSRRLLEIALEIQERVLGPEHPRVAQSLDHLGWVARELGD